MTGVRGLLCAAALAAGGAAGQEASTQDETPGSAEAAEPEGEPPAKDDSSRATEVGASAQVSASGRGSRELLLTARFRRSGVSLDVGAESLTGPRAPERRGLVFGAGAELGDDVAVQIDAHVLPEQEQMSRAAGEAWIRIGWLGAGLLVRRTSLGVQRLDALGAGVDLFAELAGIESELRVVAWRIELATSRSRDPWTAFGQRTLDWPERWQAELSGRRPFGRVALTAAAAVSQSPLPHLFVRAGAGIELKVGPAVLSAAASAAQAPDGFAPELTAGVAVGAPP